MTTIIDPLGTPSVVYNKSGVNIQNVTASGSGSNAPASSAPVLSSISEWNVVLITVPDSGDVDVVLPSDSNIGDVFELHNVGTAGAVHLWSSGSMTIGEQPSGYFWLLAAEGGSGQSRYGSIFRKVSSSLWAII